jgi:hypothetical protein
LPKHKDGNWRDSNGNMRDKNGDCLSGKDEKLPRDKDGNLKDPVHGG